MDADPLILNGSRCAQLMKLNGKKLMLAGKLIMKLKSEFNPMKSENLMSDENQMSLRDQVIAWLHQNLYTRASFERLISHVPGVSTYEQLRDLVHDNQDIFRPIVIKGGYEGLALVTASEEHAVAIPMVVEGVITQPTDDHPHQASDMQVAPIYPNGDVWADLSAEEYREYVYRNGQAIRVNSPLQLKVGEIVQGRIGGPAHYITAADGMGHTIPAGWLKLSWKTKAGREIFGF